MNPPETMQTGNAAPDAFQISQLRHPADVSEFLRFLGDLRRSSGLTSLIVCVNKPAVLFPNAAVPISAIIDTLRRDGVSVTTRTTAQGPMVDSFCSPLEATPVELHAAIDPLSRVWRFSEDGVYDLVTTIVKSICERVECAPGVIDSLNWSLNEIMDNVLQHSLQPHGYVMAQVHTDTRRIAICVCDLGQGIFESFRGSAHHPSTAADAITLAIREGVTRDPNIGQGNGLFGLVRIVKTSGGRLSITSGPGSIFMLGDQARTFNRLPFLSPNRHGTIVDFQIDGGTAANITEALGGFSPTNLIFEAIESGDCAHNIIVRDHSHGTGTRKSAEMLRNFVVNTLTEFHGKVVLDFAGLGVVASSFADELVGKLMVRLGLFGFQQAIELRGMNATVQSIVNRSVAQRMAQSLLPNTNTTDDT